MPAKFNAYLDRSDQVARVHQADNPLCSLSAANRQDPNQLGPFDTLGEAWDAALNAGFLPVPCRRCWWPA